MLMANNTIKNELIRTQDAHDNWATEEMRLHFLNVPHMYLIAMHTIAACNSVAEAAEDLFCMYNHYQSKGERVGLYANYFTVVRSLLEMV